MAKCFQLIKSKDSDTYTPESLDSLKNAIFNEFCKASLASRKGPDAVK
jgi:hypothetical protein